MKFKPWRGKSELGVKVKKKNNIPFGLINKICQFDNQEKTASIIK